MMKKVTTTALLSVLLLNSTSFAEDTYFRLKPQEQLLQSKSAAEKPEAIYSDIRANPGKWRENEIIHFPVSVYPIENAKIRSQDLPGDISYNEGLRAFIGNTTAGSPPYRHEFTIYAEGLTFSEKKKFDLFVYPELKVSFPTYLEGRVGENFTASPTSSGIVGVGSWSISTDIPGLDIGTSNGVLSGTLTTPGTYTGALSLVDSIDGKSAATSPFTFKVSDTYLTKTISSGVQINLQNYFSAEEWSGDRDKIAVVPAGAIIGSSSPTVAALTSGSGWGGTLTLRIEGEVQGAGGNANGGTGGNAIFSQDSRLVIQNNGSIKAGGGGGGQGGKGGNGSYLDYQEYTYPYSRYSANWELYSPGIRIYLNDTGYKTFSNANLTYFDQGQWRYYRGTRMESYGGVGHQIYRRLINPNSVSVSGGVGGKGGVGQGYNVNYSNGSGGSSSNNGAGTGGSGGNGGRWGTAGSPGASGANGSAGSGLSGANGGLPGFAIAGSASVSGSGQRIGR